MLKSKLCLTTCAVLALSVPALAEKPMAKATADLVNASGNMIGTVTAMEATKGTILKVEAGKLPEGWHALHVHMVGDCSDNGEGFKLSGGHVNPHNDKHGYQNSLGYEVGDLPNVYAHEDGTVKAEMHSRMLKISEHLLDKDGAALVMHENPDDMKTQPIGGAGKRIACAAFNKGN